MKWGILTFAAAITGLVLAAFWFVNWKPTTHGTETRASQVLAILIQPQGASGGEIECDGFAQITFTYEIHNHGEEPISDLKLGLGCGCESFGALPAEIRPGQSAPVSFRLRAPIAGVLRREISLLVEGSQNPLLVLKPVLRVKFHPPGFLPPLEDLYVTRIIGDSSPREFGFETIEPKGTDPWIQSLLVKPAGMLEVISLRTEDLPLEDPDLTRRHYKVQLANRSLEIGKHRVSLDFTTRPGSPPVEKPLNVEVNVLDSVVIIPNPLVFRYEPGLQPEAKRVQVFYRTGQGAATIVSYDDSLVRVGIAEEGGAVTAFGVTPVAANAPWESQVVFNVGNNQTRTLAVQFEPAQSVAEER
jgi:hypothetical protein